jgi:hypothetical protein
MLQRLLPGKHMAEAWLRQSSLQHQSEPEANEDMSQLLAAKKTSSQVDEYAIMINSGDFWKLHSAYQAPGL